MFEGIGSTPGTGRINSEGLVELLRRKLPAEEVESAVEAAMIDAGYAGEPGSAWHDENSKQILICTGKQEQLAPTRREGTMPGSILAMCMYS